MHRGNGPRGSLWLLLLAVCLHPGARAEAPKGGWTEAESSLKKAVQTGSVSAAKRIIADLARTGDPRGIELIVQNALDAGHAEIYAQAAGWLRELKEPALRRVVCGALEKGSSYRARIVLVAVIGSWKEDPAALDALLRLLGDPRKEVIFAALQRIRDFQQPDRSLPALIAELEKREKRKHDRVYFDIRRTLEHLSGHDFDVAADWKNYWSALQSGIKIPERKKEGVTQLYKPASFFTVSVESDRVAFLIDISGSMTEEDPVVEKEEDLKKAFIGEGVTVVRRPKPEDGAGGAPGGPRMRSRLSAVKEELIRTVQALPESTYFTVISFNHERFVFDNTATLIPATAANKARVVNWVKTLQPSGATRTDIVLAEALRMAQVDTICLLTDGAPKNENNERIPPEYVYNLVREENRFRKCRIHTIGFLQAGSSMRAFVRELARQNDGKCVLLE